MILGFSTQLNGKPTYFVEKIWKGLSNEFILKTSGYPSEVYPKEYLECLQKDLVNFEDKRSKLHTIREDTKDRWKAGNKIDFFINCRQKHMFRFAPVLPVVSVQKIEIKWFDLFGKKMVRVFIDDKSFACVKYMPVLNGVCLGVTGNIEALAQNDGFDTIADFFAYFDKDFTGKIIHWTDLKY